MITYVALLRAVNVGGNPLSMDRLRAICAELGYAHIRTYVQSGNVVFQSEATADAIARVLEDRLEGEARLPVKVFVRSDLELAEVLRNNPFAHQAAANGTKVHATFLSATPSPEAVRDLAAVSSGNDECQVIGTIVHLHCPDGYGRSKLVNSTIERRLRVAATTRNWNTVVKLHEMAQS